MAIDRLTPWIAFGAFLWHSAGHADQPPSQQPTAMPAKVPPPSDSFAVPAEIALAPWDTPAPLVPRGLPMVAITRTAIMAGKPLREVAVVVDGLATAESKGGNQSAYFLDALHSRLGVGAAADLGARPKGAIALVTDRHVRVRTLVDVAYTIDQAGFDHIELIVGGAEGIRSIPLKWPKIVRGQCVRTKRGGVKHSHPKGVRCPKGETYDPYQRTAPQDTFVVKVASRGFVVAHNGTALCRSAFDCTAPTVPLVDGRLDFAALRRLGRERRDLVPPDSVRTLLISGEDSLPIEHLVRAIDALRADSHGALYENVVLFVSPDSARGD